MTVPLLRRLIVCTQLLINYIMAESSLSMEECAELLRIIGPHNRSVQEILTEAKDAFTVKEFMFCKSLQAMLAAGVGQDDQSY